MKAVCVTTGCGFYIQWNPHKGHPRHLCHKGHPRRLCHKGHPRRLCHKGHPRHLCHKGHPRHLCHKGHPRHLCHKGHHLQSQLYSVHMKHALNNLRNKETLLLGTLNRTLYNMATHQRSDLRDPSLPGIIHDPMSRECHSDCAIRLKTLRSQTLSPNLLTTPPPPQILPNFRSPDHD